MGVIKGDTRSLDYGSYQLSCLSNDRRVWQKISFELAALCLHRS